MGTTKKINQVTPMGTMQQAAFADLAAVLRVAQAGLDWHPLGDVANATSCLPNTPVMVYNSTGATIFVAFGAQAMGAPTTASNGIPIAAGEKFVCNSGANSFVRASGAGLFAYNADLN
jgi:hypothetical protein